MPSPSKSQLNISVDTELKEQFKSLCDSHEISLAKAFEAFMTDSIVSKKVLGSPSIGSADSPSIERLENAIKTIEASLLEK